jgi:hypothetical protein
MATRRSIWILIGMIVITAWLLGSVTQVGAESFTVKARQIQHTTKAHIIEVGDVPGHILAAYEAAGLVFSEDGEVATLSGRGMIDYTHGSGTAQGYNLHTYEDGSTTWAKWRGTATAAPDGKTSLEGTWEYIKGTGRFEGIRGGETFTGKRFAPVPGMATQHYSDITGTYTLPSK